MPFPIIGLTTYNDNNQYGFPIAALMHKYVQAASEAGGIPVLIPSGLTEDARRALFNRMDGILFTGGGDISIEHFGGEAHPRIVSMDAERDAVEIALLKAAARGGKPFLGICRGFQVMNVALGGTLYTDLGDQMPGALKHDYDSGTQRQFMAHVVKVKESRLAGILGETDFQVNSLHHQGAKVLGAGLQAAAYAPDGLVEAVELSNHPFGFAVQWHPEWLLEFDHARRLFAALVEACSG